MRRLFILMALAFAVVAAQPDQGMAGSEEELERMRETMEQARAAMQEARIAMEESLDEKRAQLEKARAAMEEARVATAPASERAMEMIRAVRIMRMQERLNLSEEQVAALLPRLSRRDSLMISHRKAQAEDFKLLKEELAKRKPSETKLKDIMNRLKIREEEHHERMRELRDEMLSVLSVQQQAKFVIFEVEFEREIRRFIGEIRKKYRGEGRSR
jgi:hypothetical protein